MKRSTTGWSMPGLAVLATLTALAAPPAAAQSQIGSIAYLEEGVNIDRDSQTIPVRDVFIGMEVENYDLLHTDNTGYAEVELDAPQRGQTVVRVSPNTSFYFEMNRIGREEATTIGMITGSLSVKVARLSGRQSVEVATESALMGVRGTDFEVTIAPAGEILVSAEQGRVSCIDDDGRELFAAPGTVVEKRPGELFREIPVAVSDLETFRRDWYADRLEAFKANALQATRSYAARYVKLKSRFDEAYEALQDNEPILSKWYEEDRRGEIGSRMDSLREKKQLIGELFELRKILYIFERVYLRLVELEDYYLQGYGRGQIEPGLSAAAFFERLDRDRGQLGDRMGEIRYITKLYAKRNEGSFPADLLEQGESEFFEQGGDLFGEDDDLSF
jgi:hypothetical protein